MYLVTSCHPDVSYMIEVVQVNDVKVNDSHPFWRSDKDFQFIPIFVPVFSRVRLAGLFIPSNEYAGLPQFSNVIQICSFPDGVPDVQKFNIETSDMCLYGRFPFRERILNIILSSTLTCRREAHYLDHQHEQSGYCVDTKECSQLALSLRAKWSLLTVWSRVKSAGTGFTGSNTLNFYLTCWAMGRITFVPHCKEQMKDNDRLRAKNRLLLKTEQEFSVFFFRYKPLSETTLAKLLQSHKMQKHHIARSLQEIVWLHSCLIRLSLGGSSYL